MMPLRQDNLFDRIANYQALHAAAGMPSKASARSPAPPPSSPIWRVNFSPWSGNFAPGYIDLAAMSRSPSTIRKSASSRRRRFATASCITRSVLSWSRSSRPGSSTISFANRTGQGHAPRHRGLRALSRPPRPRSALRHLPLFPGDRRCHPEIGLAPPDRLSFNARAFGLDRRWLEHAGTG